MRLPGHSIKRIWLALAGALALAGCGSAPPDGFTGAPAPALWEVRTDGQLRGWLFGTIHALPDGVEWRSAELDGALANSQSLVVEVANLADSEARAEQFAQLATSGEQPPITERIDTANAARLEELLEQGGFKPGHFHRTETWAAALMIAQVIRSGDSNNGADRTLIADYPAANVVELEGAAAQLTIFDRLPEAEQRDLLGGVVAESNIAEQDPLRLARAWYAGDMDAIVAAQASGILADPELREALLTRRNADWAVQIDRRLQRGKRPFIAVGAAHLPGPDGLVAMLEQRGYTVTRIQ